MKRIFAISLMVFCLLSAPDLPGRAFSLARTQDYAEVEHPVLVSRGPSYQGALSRVSRQYGLSEEVVARMLGRDSELWVDSSGQILFACEGLEIDPSKASALSSATAVESSSIYSVINSSTDAFKLHSLPGCARVLYLDFTGHTTSGTSWNSVYNAGGDIVSAAYDTDGDPLTFSDAERAAIKRIWERVAEDYAPFSVDVTTEDPGSAGIIKTGASDTAYGQRVVISPTSAWYGSAGGVAYLYSFGSTRDSPCFIFSNKLGNAEKYIADAVAHELGHTLGLSHDGVIGGTGYYSGHGNWGPIMGTPYYQAVAQWSCGEYTSANNQEDDLAILSQRIPILSDDYGNTPATAGKLTGPDLLGVGLIERRTDLDVFAIQVGTGVVSIRVDSTNTSPNLKIQADLLNASGGILASGMAEGMGSAIYGSVTAGTVYLQVQGVGSGTATTGYSDYGSLGEYVISGTVPLPKVLVPPTASASASSSGGVEPFTVSFDGSASGDSDGSVVSWTWDFGDGGTAVGAKVTHTYTTYGNYTAVLTVTDSDACTSTTSLVIAVAQKPNVAPVAVASANVISGSAPLSVVFSGSQSSDSDGLIVGYEWSFGDGSTSSLANPTKTYANAGNYLASLRVTDNRGGTAMASCMVNVVLSDSKLYDLASYSLVSNKRSDNSVEALAYLVFRDSLGRPLAGVMVRWHWTGDVTGVSTGYTDAQGSVVLASPSSKTAAAVVGQLGGCGNPDGYHFNPSVYAEPSMRSISIVP